MKSLLLLIYIALTTHVFSFQETVEGGKISYDPQDWPNIKLTLSPEGTLKDLFDAGLRPYRIPGHEHSDLLFKHCQLNVISPERKQFPQVTVEYSEIHVKPSGLWKMTTTSPRITLVEAKKQMQEWLPIINKTEAELDSFLTIVSENFLNYDDRDFGKASDGFYGNWRGNNKENYTVWLAKGYNSEKPLRICFRVYWLKSRGMNKSGTFYQGPIQPPVGYENVSMEAPEKWGPDSAVTIAKWRGEDIGDGTGTEFQMRSSSWKPRQNATLIHPQHKTRSIANEKPPEPEKKLSNVPRFIACVMLLGILAVCLKKFKKNSRYKPQYSFLPLC